MLDINLFREEKGGDPNVVRNSQRSRNKPVELVDEVIFLDKAWRRSKIDLLLLLLSRIKNFPGPQSLTPMIGCRCRAVRA
jgi:seryl-tRNA synthetase